MFNGSVWLWMQWLLCSSEEQFLQNVKLIISSIISDVRMLVGYISRECIELVLLVVCIRVSLVVGSMFSVSSVSSSGSDRQVFSLVWLVLNMFCIMLWLISMLQCSMKQLQVVLMMRSIISNGLCMKGSVSSGVSIRLNRQNSSSGRVVRNRMLCILLGLISFYSVFQRVMFLIVVKNSVVVQIRMIGWDCGKWRYWCMSRFRGIGVCVVLKWFYQEVVSLVGLVQQDYVLYCVDY